MSEHRKLAEQRLKRINELEKQLAFYDDGINVLTKTQQEIKEKTMENQTLKVKVGELTPKLQ